MSWPQKQINKHAAKITREGKEKSSVYAKKASVESLSCVRERWEARFLRIKGGSNGLFVERN